MKPLRLIDAEPEFFRFRKDADGHHYRTAVATLGEADGISFLCPLCYEKNGGAVGTHQVMCWFEGKVADDVLPGPGRWKPEGKGFSDLSFVPGKKSRSVKLESGCNWHGYLTNGVLT